MWGDKATNVGEQLDTAMAEADVAEHGTLFAGVRITQANITLPGPTSCCQNLEGRQDDSGGVRWTQRCGIGFMAIVASSNKSDPATFIL